MTSEIIPIADLPLVTPGPGDYLAGVQNGNARRFPMQPIDGMLGYATRADLYADLAHGVGTLAVVTNDPVLAYNGTYRKTGVSGSGSWTLAVDRVSDLESRMDVVEVTEEAIRDGGTQINNGITGPFPLLADQRRRILLGFDPETNEVIARGLVNAARSASITEQVLGESHTARYVGNPTVIPIVTDATRKVLLGYDVTNARIIGAGLTSGGGSTGVAMEPLAAGDEPATVDYNHMLFYGQSLSVGAQGTPVISTTQPYSNLTVHGGPRAWTGAAYDFASLKPLVEDSVNPAPDGGSARGESPCSAAANYAVTLAITEAGLTPSDHIVLASTAGHGSWMISQLDKAPSPSWYADTFLRHVSEARTLALAAGKTHAVHCVNYGQGEQDASNGTTYVTYYSTAITLQSDAEADIQAITGQTSPVYFLLYQCRASIAENPDPALAHLSLAQNSDRFFLVTPIYHLPHDADDTHLTATGYKWLGAYYGRAYKQLVIDHVKPKWLNPRSATLRGSEIRVRFDVPVAPMVLDADTLAETTDYGFAVEDTVGVLTIDSVGVDGSDIVITLSAPPVGATEVRYALDYLGAGLGINNGSSGNLRDSAPEVITVSGTDLPLYNVAPSFRLTVIALGE